MSNMLTFCKSRCIEIRIAGCAVLQSGPSYSVYDVSATTILPLLGILFLMCNPESRSKTMVCTLSLIQLV